MQWINYRKSMTSSGLQLSNSTISTAYICLKQFQSEISILCIISCWPFMNTGSAAHDHLVPSQGCISKAHFKMWANSYRSNTPTHILLNLAYFGMTQYLETGKRGRCRARESIKWTQIMMVYDLNWSAYILILKQNIVPLGHKLSQTFLIWLIK